MMQASDDWRQKKEQMRLAARRRPAPADRDALSRRIWSRLVALPEYARAEWLMTYLDLGGEVRTTPFLSGVWNEGKRIVVPYCEGDGLRLFALEHLDELAPGMLGIQEPLSDLRNLAERRVDLERLDLIVVPGLAFDRRGGRLGRGKGYYDRLLAGVGPGTALVGLAFECQIVDEVPVLPHDVLLDKVVTEETVYDGGRRTVGR